MTKSRHAINSKLNAELFYNLHFEVQKEVSPISSHSHRAYSRNRPRELIVLQMQFQCFIGSIRKGLGCVRLYTAHHNNGV